MRPRLAIAVLAALAFGVYPLAGCAQDAGEAAATAAQALNAGDYAEARRLFKDRLATPDSARALAVAGYFETFLAVGEYAEGLREADALLARTPDDAALLFMKGRLLVEVGRYADAEDAFRAAGRQQPDFWRDALELADLLQKTGRRAEATRLYAAIYQGYKQGQFRTARTLGIAGRAAAALEQFHDANAAFRTAYRLDAADVQVLFWWAELFREKYNDADAQRTYEDALQVNPRHADLYVGYARSFGDFGRREQLAREALEVNPNSVAAMNLLAGLRVLDGLYAEAEAMAQKALGVNPASVEALAHLAAVHHLRGDTAAFAGAERRALDVNPHASDFYVTVSEDLALRFRYPDAAAFSRKAVEADPEDERALASLGTGLLRRGEAAEARRYLERSFRADPFNLFVGNTLTLLDEYADFDLLESEHFRLLIHSAGGRKRSARAR